MYENKAFTDKIIGKLQSVDRGNDWFVSVLTRYLVERNRIMYDPDRDLFWVLLPNGSFQVAIWMMQYY